MLFNVRTDPGDWNDLAGQHQGLARELRPLITAWETGVDAESRRHDAGFGAVGAAEVGVQAARGSE